MRKVTVRSCHQPSIHQVLKHAKEEGYRFNCIEDIPHSILGDLIPSLMMRNATKGIPDGEVFLMVFGEVHGLAPVKAQKINGVCFLDVEDTMAIVGEEWNEENESALKAIADSHIRIPKGELFSHPLVEITEIDGEECLNNWGFAVMLINGLVNPDFADEEKCEAVFCNIILEESPGIDLSSLLAKVKAGYYSACQQAAGLLAEGFDKRVKKAFDIED